jgi:hypothetical protein
LAPGGYTLLSCLVAEVVLTFFFFMIIMGSTDKRGVPAGFAPIAIGLGLTLIHLIGIPVTNLSGGEPGAQHGTRDFCGRMGALAIVAVLAGSDCGWSAGGRILSRGIWGVDGDHLHLSRRGLPRLRRGQPCLYGKKSIN